MDFRFTAFDPQAQNRQERIDQLLAAYEHLLLRANGQVERALDWLDQIATQYKLWREDFDFEDFKQLLRDRQWVEVDASGKLTLSGAGERSLRVGSLDAIFSGLQTGAGGNHRTPQAGRGSERLSETRPWKFGDSYAHLATGATLHNALRRRGIDALRRGEHDGLRIEEEDLVVYETEHDSSCATVLLIDVSHSMILYGEDRITPAKRVALALTELIRTRYPKDRVHVVLFGDNAWEVPLDQIPYCGVGPFHTNTRAGLQLAQELLRKSRQPNRQIFMVTDGKPSALTERNGSIYKNPNGLDPRVVNKTLEEAERCQRLGIPITTFMLTEDPYLTRFVERFTEANRGRAYYSGCEDLGSFVFVDYLQNRRRRQGG